jgi:hypothetical protein
MNPDTQRILNEGSTQAAGTFAIVLGALLAGGMLAWTWRSPEAILASLAFSLLALVTVLPLSLANILPKHSRSRWRGGLGVLLCCAIWLGPTGILKIKGHHLDLYVTGIVKQTGADTPVSDAKVIATVWVRGVYEAYPVRYGTTTDKDGAFVISETVTDEGKRLIVRREIDLEASTPDNQYAMLYKVRNGEYVLQAADLQDWQRDKAYYQYPTFTGFVSSRRGIKWSKEGDRDRDAPRFTPSK